MAGLKRESLSSFSGSSYFASSLSDAVIDLTLFSDSELRERAKTSELISLSCVHKSIAHASGIE